MKQAASDMKWNALQNCVCWEALQYSYSESEYAEALLGVQKPIFGITDTTMDRN